MSVRVFEADDGDMGRIFEICSLAFARNEPFFDTCFPDHWLASGRRAGGERMLKSKNNVPQCTFLKAVHETTGEIVGMARWLIYENSSTDTKPAKPEAKDLTNYWASEDDMQFAADITAVFLEERDEAIRRTNGNVVSLDILAVDPSYQRTGAGGALVKWGTAKADKIGLETVVESSVFGKGLYEKNGFVMVKNVELHVPDKWRGRPGCTFAWLIRPKSVKSG